MTMNAKSNYSREAVPVSDRRPAWALVNLTNGIYNTLPCYIVASSLVYGLGFSLGASIMWAALLIAAALAVVTAQIGAKTGLTTTNINIHTFGRKGSIAPNLIIFAGAVGWFGLTLGFFSIALDQGVQFLFNHDIPLWIYSLVSGVVMTVIVLYGFKGLDWLNRVAIPVLIAFLAWIAFDGVQTHSLSHVLSFPRAPGAEVATIAAGLTAAIGAVIAGPCAMGDTMRFARNRRSGAVAALTAFGLVIPVILIMSAVPVTITGEADFIQNLLSLSLGIVPLLILIIATFTTNVLNVYVGSLSLSRLAPKMKERNATLICGFFGTLLALFGITDNVLAFFILIGVSFPPIAGVYIAHYHLEWKREGAGFDISRVPAARMRAVIAWLIGSGAAYLTQYNNDVSLTMISAIDGVAVSFLAYTAMHYFYARKRVGAASQQASS